MYLKQLVHSDYCYTLCHFLLHFLSLYNQKLIMWGIQKRVVKYFTVEKSSFILKTCVITSHKIISWIGLKCSNYFDQMKRNKKSHVSEDEKFNMLFLAVFLPQRYGKGFHCSENFKLFLFFEMEQSALLNNHSLC